MTTQTAATIIREAYLSAPSDAEQSTDNEGNSVLTIGDRRFVLGTETGSTGEFLNWAEYAAVRWGVTPAGVDWDLVAQGGCPIEDAEQARSALRAFVA